MQRSAQAAALQQPKPAVAPNQSAFNTQLNQYQNKLRAVWPPLKILLDTLPALNTTQVYTDPSPLVLYLKQLKSLWGLLNGAPGDSLRLNMTTMPAADQAVPDELSGKYKAAQTAEENFRSLAPPLFEILRNLQTIANTAAKAKEEWVFAPAIMAQVNVFPKAVEVGRFLGLTQLNLSSIKLMPPPPPPRVKASIKTAYPMAYSFMQYPIKNDLEKWNKVAPQIASFERVYKDYTFPQVLYHFTKDWNMFERYSFKKWYTWMYRQSRSQNKMEKHAFAPGQKDFIFEDRVQKFEKKRKLLLSRINLVRKALHDMINNSLIPGDNANRIYKVLSMLEFETLGLSAPKVASARIRRASRQIEKLGFTEGGSILASAANDMLAPDALVKTAEDDDKNEKKEKKDTKGQIVDVLGEIKKEMDLLNYNRHLDSLYQMKKKLEAVGRQNDADSILKVIREDLDGLDKLNKKLSEVYTNLSKIPIQMSDDEDIRQHREHKKHISEEKPIEVTEEEATQPAMRQERPAPEARPTAAPQAPVAPPAPQLQTEIPNV